MTDFTGVSFGVRDNKLCAIATSSGYGIADLGGVGYARLSVIWQTS